MESRIIVADVDPLKREAALNAVADEVVDNGEPGIIKELLKQTNGGPYGVVDFLVRQPRARSDFKFSKGRDFGSCWTLRR